MPVPKPRKTPKLLIVKQGGNTRESSASVPLFELLRCLFAELPALSSADPAGWWAVVPRAK